jgi:hypothetical protein
MSGSCRLLVLAIRGVGDHLDTLAAMLRLRRSADAAPEIPRKLATCDTAAQHGTVMMSIGGPSKSCFRTFADQGFETQRPSDVTVIMPTVMRKTIPDALRSVFRQDLAGRIQILVGIDHPDGDIGLIEQACSDRPSHCCVQVVYPGYSTSVRHGGLHPARDGGVLRTVLTYLANSRHVAYLDDDNWWAENHLSSMRAAIEGHDWAFSLRWFVHPETRRQICVDRWESLGPGKGVFSQGFGGWVDPNCLMFDKFACEPIIPLWARPMAWDAQGITADRQVFGLLRQNQRWRATGQPSVYYQINPDDINHGHRVQAIGEDYAKAGRREIRS